MKLTELLVSLDQHGVSLSVTADSRLNPTAEQRPPDEVVEGIKAHRAELVRRLERGQRADGRYYLEDLQARPGICASCAHWQQVKPGDLHGRCPLAGCVEIHAAHRCPPEVNAWKASA